MVSKRSYKPSMSVEFAVNELERGAGAQFDPELVPVFIGLVKDGSIRPVLDDGNEGSHEDGNKASPGNGNMEETSS